MTSIFDELITDWHHATEHLHHHQPQPAYDHHDTTQQEETRNLTGIHQAITDGIGNIEGWAENLKSQLPEIAAKAAQIDQSPIVAALEGIVLPPAVEAEIASLIAKLGAEFPAATAQPLPIQPAEPQPATA